MEPAALFVRLRFPELKPSDEWLREHLDVFPPGDFLSRDGVLTEAFVRANGEPEFDVIWKSAALWTEEQWKSRANLKHRRRFEQATIHLENMHRRATAGFSEPRWRWCLRCEQSMRDDNVRHQKECVAA